MWKFKFFFSSLNICKKQDTRDSMNRHVIALYTYEDCLSILFEEEQELQNWLVHLLRLQRRRGSGGSGGEAEDGGKMPRPRYENMWQVLVKSFRPDDPQNPFVMEGTHRISVTQVNSAVCRTRDFPFNLKMFS